MEKMKVSDFEVKLNTKINEEYVVKVKDELTKNHKDIEHIVSGVMPENRTDPLCPVASFKQYLSHLNPQNNYMWQKPLDSVDINIAKIWYGRQHVGKNPLRTFMSDLSEKLKLSQIYTNHSIRVTGCTVLNRFNFSASEIMSVSGHKSVQSLSLYQKTQHKQKVKMGNALFQSMTKPEDDIEIHGPKQLQPPPTKPALLPPINSEKALVPITPNEVITAELVPLEPNFEDDDMSDLDLLSAICGIENQNQNVSVTKTSTVVSNTMPRAMFANCQIGTLNVTINKL